MLINLEDKPKRIVPGVGSATAKIAIVGEAPGSYEDMQLKPFVGPAGTVLENCLHASGITRSECYLTNVVKVRPKGNLIDPFFSKTKGTFTADGIHWVNLLREELNDQGANIILACGATAQAALTGEHKVMKYRGYVFESIGLTEPRKVIPTIHPAASLSLSEAEWYNKLPPGKYIYRHMIVADMKKAKAEAGTRELVRPNRQLIYNFQTVNEVLEWLEYYEKASILAFDIEVLNYEISCISFASDHSIAISVPLADKWTEGEELAIYRGIQRVLGNPASIKVAQNAIFDVHFLLTRCGIEVRGPIHDTMVGHSVMYSELPKSLAFLVSVYGGTQAYYKDMVKFTNLKEES